MRREILTLFVAFAVTVACLDPQLDAQFAPDPNQGYPPYQQQQPTYPQQQQGGYPQQGYPQQGYPQTGGQGYPQGQAGENEQDVPGDQQHGVARLSLVQGDVNVRRADSGELTAAISNAPLMTHDRVQTSAGSRAEVQLDYGNLVRLGPDTELNLNDVEYGRFQLQLGAGTVIYRVLRDSGAQVELDTPSIAMRATSQGEYRVSVLEDGTTQITVRSGSAEVFSPRGSQQLAQHQTMLVRGNPSDPEFQSAYELARDQLDDWSMNRDADLLRSQSYQYVNRDVQGADDLDPYGSWVPSQYGQVWNPRPPVADWSPYSDGHWVWENYYGWSWVDNAPWGWAPYHYGRWFWNGGRGWCWWPGPIGVRAYWSPALVGFFGFGAGLAAGIAAGIGWVALAPFEAFHPWWGRFGFGFGYGGGFGYRGGFGYGRFDAFHGNFAGMYRNAAIRGGAMTAAYGQFGSHFGRFNPATREQLLRASEFRGQLPVRPTQASYRFSNRTANANPRLASSGNRSFFQHSQFGAGGFGRTTGGGFGNGQQHSQAGVQNGRGGPTPNVTRGATGGGSGSGWQRFGDSGRTGNFQQGFAGSQNQNGWHNFGQSEHGAVRGSTPQNTWGGGNSGYRGNTSRQPSFGGRSYPSGSYPRSNGFGNGSYPRSNGFGNGSYPRSNGGSFGGGGSTPRYSAPPSYSNHGGFSGGGGASPHYSQPRGGGGGGGGHFESHGGGGGGGHSSGGHSGGGGGHSGGGGGHRH